MDRDGVRSKRNDNGDETILELASTGNSSEVLPTSANEGSRGIKSTSSEDADVQSLPDQLEGGQSKSMSFRLSGRQYCKRKKVRRVSGKGKKDGFGEKRGAIMVVSVLIATLTYQAALNPPGGFWQDDGKGSADTAPPPAAPPSNRTLNEADFRPNHSIAPTDVQAGTAINRNINGFQYFLIANTVGLFSSLVIILLLTSAITVRRQIMMWLLMFIMWVSVFSVAFSFFTGALIILRTTADPAAKYLLAFAICCAVLFALLVILHMVVGFKEVHRWAKKKPPSP